jgi:hypothetical protein
MAYLEMKDSNNNHIASVKVRVSYGLGSSTYWQVCAVNTLISISQETELVIKSARVTPRSITMKVETLDEDQTIVGVLVDTEACFTDNHCRTFGHDSEGRDVVEGERIRKWGVIREANGNVTMYIRHKASHMTQGMVACNLYGVPCSEYDHARLDRSPLYLEMDGFWSVSTKWLGQLKYRNNHTLKGARVLFEGDSSAKSGYDPC